MDLILLLFAGLLIAGLTIRNPIWGLAILIGLEPMITILPRVEFLSSLSPLVGAILLISYLPRLLRRREPIKSMEPGFTFCILWFISSVLVGQYGFNIPSSRNWLLTYIQLVLMVWILVQLMKSEKDILLLMKIFLGFIFVNSLFGLEQLNTQYQIIPGDLFRISGLTGNANEFAIYAAIGILFSLFFLKTATGFSRTALFIILTSCLSAVLFSGSRGGLLFIALSVLYTFIRQGNVKSPKLISLILIAVVFYGIWLILPYDLQIRFSEIPQAILYGEDTVGVRYQAWKVAFVLWRQSPLFGIGVGGFQYYNQLFNLVPGHNYIVPHNMYITILTETGLFGFLPFILIFVIAFGNYIQAGRKALGDKAVFDLVVVWQAVFLFLLMAGIKGSLQYTKVVWLAMGIGLSLRNLPLLQPGVITTQTKFEMNSFRVAKKNYLRK